LYVYSLVYKPVWDLERQKYMTNC